MPSHKSSVDDAMITLFGYDINIYGAILTIMFAVFLFALYRAQKAERLNWLDMITATGSNKVSTTKILQLVGGVVATWIVIKMTLQGSLNWDIFAIYLGYVASIDGFSKLLMAKYGSNSGGQNGYQQPQYGGYQSPQYGGYQQNQAPVNTTPAVVAPPTQDEQIESLNDNASRGAAKPPQD